MRSMRAAMIAPAIVDSRAAPNPIGRRAAVKSMIDGGREIAAIAGAIIAARMERIPVILDGYVVCSAAAILHALDPRALDHCMAAHVSAEGGHADVLRRLGKKPLLDLGLRLGEGTGAALAFGIIKSAIACHTGMATFAEAKVARGGEH